MKALRVHCKGQHFKESHKHPAHKWIGSDFVSCRCGQENKNIFPAWALPWDWFIGQQHWSPKKPEREGAGTHIAPLVALGSQDFWEKNYMFLFLLFQGGPVEILPFLYLGSAYHASKCEFLANLHITALLNVSRKSSESFKDQYCYKWIPVEDSHTADISSHFQEAIDFIGRYKWTNFQSIMYFKLI